MSQHKALRIGLVGCGFMGRTHSNGYKRVGIFFRPRIPAGIKSGVFQKLKTVYKRLPNSGVTNLSKPTGKSLSPVMISMPWIFARPTTLTNKLLLPLPRQAKWCSAKSHYPEH